MAARSKRSHRPRPARRLPWHTTVASLAAELKGFHESGRPQADILDHLREAADAHGFEFRNDWMLLTVREVDMAETAAGHRPSLPRTPRAGTDTVRVVGRVMLCRQGRGLPRARRDTASELDLACGVVFDALRWDVIAVTPRMFSLAPDEGVVDQGLARGDYAVIRPRDGSLVTLYHWAHPVRGSVWCLATSRGYDVSGLSCPGGDMTWAEMVYGVMERTGVAEELGARLDRGALAVTDVDPSFCYTLSVRCHAMHPLLADPEGICAVQTVRVIPEEDEPLTYRPFFDVSLLRGVGGQTLIPDAGLTLASLRASCANALPEAIAAVAAGAAGAAGDGFNYGYVLRSLDPAATRGSSDLVVESPLQVAIRQHMYRPPAAEDGAALSETPADRMKYNAVRAAFSPRGNREEIVGLFPQYADLIRRCEAFLAAVIDQTVSRALRTHGGAPPPTTTNAERHAAAVLRHITDQHANFNPFDAETVRGVVEGYVYEVVGPLALLQACP